MLAVARFVLAAEHATLNGVDVSAADIAKIPAENLRVSRADFSALWMAVERIHEEQAQRGASDWYTAGVVVTCRWLAQATVRPDVGPPYLADSPVTERTARAYPELIEAEYLAAEKLAMRHPRPTWLANRPGWIESILATLCWTWCQTGKPPLDVRYTARRT